MPIASASHSRSTAVARALVVLVTVSALVACQRAETARTDTPVAASTARAPETPAEPPASGLDVSEIFVILEAVGSGEVPADFLVTDPGGRRTGAEPGSFRKLLEMSHASYDSSPPPTQTDTDPPPRAMPKQFELVTPEPGTYRIDVLGRRADAYTLTVRIITPGGERREAIVRNGRVRPGQIQRYSFTYARADTGSVLLSGR